MKRVFRVLAVGLVLGVAAHWLVRTHLFGPSAPTGAATGVSAAALGDALEEVATGLEIPWEIAFLPGGDLLLTERPGRLVRLAPDGARRWSVEVPDVVHRGEGGLLGLALHPDFATNRWIYLYLTTDAGNRVERWRLAEDGALTGHAVLVEGIPAASFHDGGRLAFGPRGHLWATTGDAGRPEAAQDTASLAGKVLRMTDHGRPSPGNPFGTRVWSLGHRNPQGLAWDAAGNLWITEHGPSGLTSGFDEVNRPPRGGNHGWPAVRGDETAPGTVPPVLHSGSEDTWAPSGAAFLDGDLWFGGLRGEALFQLPVQPGGGTAGPLVAHLFGDLGRIRQVRVGPEGHLWILTGNRDGRGRPRSGDDRVLRVAPEALTGGS